MSQNKQIHQVTLNFTQNVLNRSGINKAVRVFTKPMTLFSKNLVLVLNDCKSMRVND